MKTVYCDVVFAANLSADLALLYMCSKFLHIKPDMKRIILSAFLGGVFGIVGAVVLNSGTKRAALAILFAPLLCRISYGKKSKGFLLKSTVSFIVLGMCLCGSVCVIAGITSYKFNCGGISVWLIFAGVTLMGCIFLFFGETASKNTSMKTVGIKIYHNGKAESFTLLCDSGNLLTDPYSMLPVIVLKKGRFDYEIDFDGFIKNKMRFIPINTANGKSLIKAIRPEKIEIIHNGKGISINAVVGFSEDEEASFENTDGIIPYSLIENL